MPVAHAPVHHASAAAYRVDAAIVRIVNDARRRYGLPRLRMSRTLTDTAAAHSSDMAAHNMLSHASSNGTPFAARLRAYTRAHAIGETLMWTTGRAGAATVVRAWMNSPPHRADLLSGNFHRIGVARARRGRSTFVTADLSS